MNEHKQQKPENDVEANKQVPNEANAPVDGTSASEAPGDSEQDRIIAEQAAEIAVLKDKMLRAMADVENMRHRAEREKEDAHNYAVTKFARDMLAVSDNLRRAIDSIPAAARENEDVKNVLPGIEMTESELLKILERYKIRKINAEGQKFDPNLHQAMYEIEDLSVEPGTILQVTQDGFVIADRLLRPAMVGVAKGGQKRAETRVDEKV